MRAVIVEDEPKSLEVLCSIIHNNCPGLSISGSASTVEQAVELITKHKPELVFLDISMPDGSGFDLLEKVAGQKFELIFTTASDQHAIRAIKFSASDYLLKPIDPDELKVAVEKLQNKINAIPNMENLQFLVQHLKQADQNFKKITLPTGNAYEIVNINDIIRCEADGSYTYFYLNDNRKLMVSLGLKHYEELLPVNDFTRVHHHHLINMNHVIRFLKEDGGYAVMSDGSKIEISRRKKEAFMGKLTRS
jgi:two-component system, LytTR family, response regulator